MTQITTQLHITDISEARETEKSQFDRVITVCQDSIEDHVPEDVAYEQFVMTDGPPRAGKEELGSYERFEEATDSIKAALEAGETVLVHCHAGISRSSSTSIAAMADLHGRTFEEQRDRVKAARPKISPHHHLESLARQYLNGGEPTEWEPSSSTMSWM